MGLIRWFILLIVRLIVWLLGLAILAAILWALWKLVITFGDRAVPALLLLKVFFLRLKSIVFLDSRFCSDRTSTYDRLENPDKYSWGAETWDDRFKLSVVNRMPNIRNTSDFGKLPLPFGLREHDKIPAYIKKVLAWTILIVAFNVVWLMGYLGENWIWVIPLWSVSIFVGLWFMAWEKRFKKSFARYSRKRFKVINRSIMEILESLSLGVVSTSWLLTSTRKRFGGLLVVLGLVVFFVLLKYYKEGISWF